MKLSCAIVSRILGARTAGEPAPAWIERHLDQCERCKAEAAEYSRLGEAIRHAASPDETLALTWNELKATLPVREARSVFRIPAFATVAAAAVAIVAICFALMTQGPAPKSVTNVAIKRQPESHVLRQPKQPLVAEKTPAPDEPTAPEVKQQPATRLYLAVIRPAPRAHQHRAPSPRIHIAPQPNEPNSTPSDDGPVMAREPDSPSYTVVGAEEHVIDVVGVGSNADSSDSDTGYVIRTTDTGDDHQVALL